MNISFYSAAVGAEQQQRRLDVHGNNIANVNTYGFRAKVPGFSQLMTGGIRGVTEDLPRGVGSRLENAHTRFASSGVADTGRFLDYAIDGYGFFALQDPDTGEITYTRDGSFTMSQLVEGDSSPWYLSDGLGRFVLDAEGNRILVEDPMQKLPVGIYDFVNYDGMQSVHENMFKPTEKNGEPFVNNESRLMWYTLEVSNVDLAYEISKVIESQRAFSFMLRMVTASDEIESTVNNLS